MAVLVDTNVIIDALLPESSHHEAARGALLEMVDRVRFVINAVIWSELAPMAGSEGELGQLCADLMLEREEIGFAAAFLAGRAHGQYRKAGGNRERTLPDFLIGAHAQVRAHALLTRDPGRYRSYFPELRIIVPEAVGGGNS